jgi:predicted nucleic acid-binding protein
MSGKNIVLDTNILLYFLGGGINVSPFFDEYNPIISFVTELELLSAPEISPNEKLFIQELLKDLTIIKYSDEHKEDVIKIRSKKKLKLPDAIVVSLAITLGLPLVTADKALKNIEGLDLIFYKIPGNE